MVQANEPLKQLLESLGESSQFGAAGVLAPVLAGLAAKGVGPIPVPVSAADAKELIRKATQAPYGRGEDTVVDTNVRRVWQLEPSQFELRNPEWKTCLTTMVDAVRKEFGIKQKVTPKLYKLLIYEKGSFFTPHRDTEKLPGMFATLVVALPSRHEGGTLIVRHGGQTKKIDFGGKDSEFQLQYAAFYADCQHEIKPVTEGHRVCLVYNLVAAGKKQPAPPENAPAVEKAAKLLKQLFTDSSSDRSKLAIPLKHQYTEAGLDPARLKGSDRPLLEVLTGAAESLDYQCYLALLTRYQSGEANYDTLDFDPWSRRSSRSGWHYDEYEEDEEDEEDEERGGDDSGVDIGEVYEEELTLNHWLDPQGRPQPFGEIHLEEDEILSPEDMDGWAFEQEVQEATGNEGVSVDRWYRHSVLVIWPRDRYFSVLAEEGQAAALGALEQMAAHGKKPDGVEACRTFAQEIIDQWLHGERTADTRSSYSGRMLKVLERIGTVELAQRFLREVLPKDYDGSEGKVLKRLCERFGWKVLAEELRDFLAQQPPKNQLIGPKPIVSICEALCCEPPALTEERRNVCRSLAADLLAALERWDRKRTESWQQPESRAGVVESVLRIGASLEAGQWLDHSLDHVLSDPRHYDLHEVLIPDVKGTYQLLAQVPAARPAAERLMQHCLEALRSATAHPIEPPSTWKRNAPLGCTCEDCQALSHFLHDPAARVARMPLRKDRRQHLHQQIDLHKIDCTHVTERQGSPQTLMLTKTQATYERRLKQYHEDQQLLAELEALAAGERPVAQKGRRRRRTQK
jgi:hypothetical protein